MNSETAERLEILRRIGERGLRLAQKGVAFEGRDELTDSERAAEGAHSEHLDLWQHLLDELKRVSTGNTGIER
jgi:hypothetical protein